MQKIKKYILSLLVGVTLSASAADAAYTVNNLTNLHYIGNTVIEKLSLTSTGSCVVFLYDNYTNLNTYSNAAYTVTTTYATNLVQIITNSLGNLQTNTFPSVYTVSSNVAASAVNPLPTLLTVACAANTTTTITGLRLITARGLASTTFGTSATNIGTLLVTYRSQ